IRRIIFLYECLDFYVIPHLVQDIWFRLENVDQVARALKHQENINKAVLSKHIRILFIPNPEKLNCTELAKVVLRDILRYENVADIHALAWIKGAGTNKDGTVNIRAEMSYSFWEYFISKGKNYLQIYNRTNKSHVKIQRERTLPIADMDNLSLYLRKKIRDYCSFHHYPIPEVNVKNGFITMKNKEASEGVTMKATILAIKLGWKYTDWKGIPILKLLTEEERKDYEDGKIPWNSYTLESLLSLENNPVNDTVEGDRHNRKREGSGQKHVNPKIPRREASPEEEENV
ncbi:hypothetical protein OSTOST_17373, partial [Ostertagia ostertagi]